MRREGRVEETIKRIVISIVIKQKQRQQQLVLPFVVGLLKRTYFIIYSSANFKVQLTPDVLQSTVIVVVAEVQMQTIYFVIRQTL